MTWQKNSAKEEWIDRCGVTAGLPLFEQSATSPLAPLLSKERELKGEVILPDWIWSGDGIKAEVYHLLKEKFAEDALQYLNALILLGGSATDHEVKQYLNDADRWQLHIVSARRNDCKKMGVVTSYPDKKKIGPYNVPNTIWFVDFRNLKIIINTP